IPFLFEITDLPLFRRHYSAHFLRQIDSSLLSQAEHRGVLSNSPDTQSLGQGIEKNITGLIDRLGNVCHSMHTMLGNHPAFEISAVEGSAAVADHLHFLRDAFLKARGSHDDLEHGARS